MSISIDDKYYFSFNLGLERDFITEGNLVQFQLVENAGNILPTFSLHFITADENIIRFLHQGIDLEVTFGKTINDSIAVPLLIENYTVAPGGSTFKNIMLTGHLSRLGYISNPKIRILPGGNKSGVEAMKEVALEYFVIQDEDSNIDASEDLGQRWVQANISDKRFMNDIWLHSYLSDSFIAIGITSEGNFVVKDVKTLVGEDPRWNFTTVAQDERDIIYDPDPIVDSSAGFINAWMGLGRDKRVHNIEDGTSELVSEDVAPLMALTSVLTRRADLERRAAEVGVRNDNVHDDYWTARQRNVMGLAVFSSLKSVLSYQGQYNRIKVLDPVLFLDTEVGGSIQTAQHHSGMYLVGTVSRELTKRTFTTTVELFREGANTPADSVSLR